MLLPFKSGVRLFLMLIISPGAGETMERYQVTVDQYVRFRRDGFLVVPQLVAPREVRQEM